MPTPRVAAIHDLSGFGRCSLTVALPILSAMGVQCCPLPTAFLSTHTGGFQNFTFLDMASEMSAAAAHWKSLQLQFQAVYSGFLGSARQIAIVSDFIRDFRTSDTIVVIDPVMGDHGQMYQTYTPELCRGMTELATMANVITPNLTEAALLLDIPYSALPTHEAGYRELVERLSLNGRRSVVLTGASPSPDLTGATCFDAASGTVESVCLPRIPRDYPGTGDIFASVLTGALVKGSSLIQAASKAAAFTLSCVRRTAAQDMDMRHGVDFEPLLGLLTGGIS